MIDLISSKRGQPSPSKSLQLLDQSTWTLFKMHPKTSQNQIKLKKINRNEYKLEKKLMDLNGNGRRLLNQTYNDEKSIEPNWIGRSNHWMCFSTLFELSSSILTVIWFKQRFSIPLESDLFRDSSLGSKWTFINGLTYN